MAHRSSVVACAAEGVQPAVSTSRHAVTPLSPGPQTYALQPADYALQAVALAAGRHHLLLHYEQPGLLLGAQLSLSTVVGLQIGAVSRRWRRT